MDHNWTTDETEATGKGQYVFSDSTTTQVDDNKVIDTVSHDVSGQVEADWDDSLLERTDLEGKALYIATFKNQRMK